MKTNGVLFIICLCIGIISACNSGYVYKVEDLSGKWNIISIKGEPVTSANIPFLEFNVAEKNVHGNTSCNILNAGLEMDLKDQSAIRLIAPITSMMACINMETEVKILQVLAEITHVQKGDTPKQAKLVDKEGNTIFILEKI